MGACTKDPSAEVSPNSNTARYVAQLSAAKGTDAFKYWPFYARPLVNSVFDHLIYELAAIGEDASEARKIVHFQEAVTSLNKLDTMMPFLIETGEAEELVAVGNRVAKAAGLDPKKYGSGEGPLSAGRNW